MMKLAILNNSEKYYLKILDFNRENYNEAISDAINAQNIKVYNNLALLSKKQDKLKETIEYYKQGIRLDPKNFVFLFNMGMIFLKKGKYKQSIKLLNKAILCKLSIIFIYYRPRRFPS